jgi:Ni/Co efflux regulator RcnB
MKSRAIVLALATAALSLGSLAYAHDDGRGDYRDWRQAQHRQYQENWFYQQQLQNQPQQYDRRLYEQRQYEPRHSQPQYNHGGYQSGYPGQGAARVPHYRRGEYLPHQFRQRQYYVNDWNARRLYAPPQGYQWVQADDSGDYLLVAMATGLIANLILNQ